MTRQVTASLAIALVFFIVVADFVKYPPNPYKAPAIVALGSGAASAGGFCGALPQ